VKSIKIGFWAGRGRREATFFAPDWNALLSPRNRAECVVMRRGDQIILALIGANICPDIRSTDRLTAGLSLSNRRKRYAPVRYCALRCVTARYDIGQFGLVRYASM
jgi:hypothetical protein